MKLSLIKYFKYSYPFNIPFVTSNNSFNNREGFIIQLKDEFGNTAFGEAAPLEGYGIETLEESENSVNSLHEFFRNNSFESIFDLNEKLIKYKFRNSVVSAITFCGLQLSSFHNSEKISFFNTFNTNIELNAVIGLLNESDTLIKVESLIQKGFRVIKLKIGRDNFGDDLKIISSIAKRFPAIFLRLDVNGNWNFKAALNNISHLEKFNIEYIEEPVNGLSNLINLADELHKLNSTLQIAADESISSYSDLIEAIRESKINYFVVKPSLLGGIINILNANKEAEKLNKKIIISSSFETSLGRYQNAIIAGLINNSSAHGIDTSDFLKHDLTDNFYKIVNNFIEIDLQDFPQNIISKLC